MGNKIIGLYGSAATQPGTPDYIAAYDLGALLAKAGYPVMTGGYGGTMGAVSHGAAEAGGKVIGVTVGLFKSRGMSANAFVHEEIELPTLADRLNYLIVKPDAYIMLNGGVGTLAELALAWSLVQVREVPLRPLILVGALWKALIPVFAEGSTITARDLLYLTLVDDVSEVVPALESWWANPPTIPHRAGDSQIIPPLGKEQ